MMVHNLFVARALGQGSAMNVFIVHLYPQVSERLRVPINGLRPGRGATLDLMTEV